MIRSKITHNGPTSGLILQWIGRFWMWLFNWEVVGKVPAGEKFVLVGAPHTSNWDFPLALLALYTLRLKVSWIGKDTLFRKPFGGFMRRLGGIAINRNSPQGIVDQIAKQFRDSRKLAIAIAPSGTRKKREYWKSGFYWIALAAEVPIACGYLDYKKKIACLGLSFFPTGNIKEDMYRIRDFFKGIQGKYPEMTTRIRLRDEDLL